MWGEGCALCSQLDALVAGRIMVTLSSRGECVSVCCVCNTSEICYTFL